MDPQDDLPQGATVLPATGDDLPAGATVIPQDSIWDKAGHLAEDVMYPTVGAAAGAALTSETGPGMIVGGALGATMGNEVKREIRDLRGRGDLNPQGLGHLTDDLMAGAGGAMQAYPLAARAVGTVEKAGGGRIMSWVVSHLRNNPSTSGMLSNMLDKPLNQTVLNTGHQLADEIAQKSLDGDPQALGNTISQAAQTVKDQAGHLYQTSLDEIGKKAGTNVPIDLSPVQTTARGLLDDLQANRGDFADVLGTQQDRQTAIGVLQKFAAPITKSSGASSVLPWNGARSIASDLDALSRSGNITLGKGALIKLKGALQSSMQTSLDAHSPAMGTAFRNASTNYATVQNNMGDALLQRLLDNKSPELAAKYILQGGSTLSKIDAIRAAVGNGSDNLLSGSVLKELLNQSTDQAGQTLKPQTLAGKWNSLSPTVRQALFPDSKHYAAVDSFMQHVDKNVLSVPPMTSAEMVQGGHIGIPLASHVPVVGKMLPHIHIDPEYAAELLSRAKSADQLATTINSKVGTPQQRQAIGALVQTMHGNSSE